MDARLWNIGAKIEDLDREIAFLLALGARLLLRETFAGPDGPSEYALLEFGGTRLFLTPRAVFETKLKRAPAPGLTHAVFETQDFERDYALIAGQGSEVLIAPIEIEAGFGRRRIAFFRSPGGLVFELMQILESRI
jgi:catechol 2,3-dioxygenase-like lactoylglutathione lyase family enzyme